MHKEEYRRESQDFIDLPNINFDLITTEEEIPDRFLQFHDVNTGLGNLIFYVNSEGNLISELVNSENEFIKAYFQIV